MRSSRVGRWGHALRRALLPGRCLLCAVAVHGESFLCAPCERELPWLGGCCRCCAAPLSLPGLCGRCQQVPPPFDAAVAVWSYAGTVPWLVQTLKYGGRLAHATFLADALLQRLQESSPERPDILLPVPLHPQRLRERGFNQALELARPVARALDVPLAATLARRVLATTEQASLTAQERRRNVADAFRIDRDLTGQRVAVVDDVMTTGSTVGALAGALRNAGARHIQVWVCARALAPR